MNEVRTFRAATMQDALDLVRTELGSDAVILHTRQLDKPGWRPWRRSHDLVEITAGLGINAPQPKAKAKAQAAAPAAKAPAPPTAPARRDQHENDPPDLSTYTRPAPQRPATPNPAVQRPATSRPAASTQQPTPRRSLASTPPAQNRRLYADSGSNDHIAANKAANKTAELEVALRNRLDKMADSIETTASPKHPTPRPPSRPASSRSTLPANFDAETLNSKLDRIQQMLEALESRTMGAAQRDIPGSLFDIYTNLIDSDVEESLARELIFRLKDHGLAGGTPEADRAARSTLAGLVESEIRCTGPIVPERGRRKVVALVGATGVGKTTSIAKLAANFRLREGIRLGLVTVDTYRIAAVEQLRTYAEIIDLPMKVVTSPPEMRRALEELAGLDLVLIDTAGRSPRDDLQIQELKSLLSEAGVDEVHLVLNMNASTRSLEATAEKFAGVRPTAMVLTKLDEAAGTGSVLSAARRIPLPISYITTGQDVPDDIEAADPHRLARLVLGEERLGTH